jgi:DNA-binding response OmpR family regulator
MCPDRPSLSQGDLTIDMSRREVTRNGRQVTLTSSEFRILEVLMASPGRLYPRRELLACLYPSGGVVIERVIDVHIRQLRKKIEDEPSRPRYVLTARGIGYRFADDVMKAPANETLRRENEGGPASGESEAGEIASGFPLLV